MAKSLGTVGQWNLIVISDRFLMIENWLDLSFFPPTVIYSVSNPSWLADEREREGEAFYELTGLQA